jgi:chaperonin cofactor prefoldin
MYADQVRAQQSIAGAGYLGGAMLGMDAAQRQPEVRAEMERLESVTDLLGKTAETLTARLETVRSQTGNQTPGSAGSAPEPVLCSYASAIRTQRQRLETVQNMLQRALNELEI